ncbi:MAG: hypothetical protein KDH97_12755 [Calditrichaeota bacterium]|nr:hypothetical protein [Calditrichota bacterium]
MADIEQIKAVKRAHERAWMALEGVEAVGIGITSSGHTGIIISVSANPTRFRRQIPERIDDVPVEIRVSGPIIAH